MTRATAALALLALCRCGPDVALAPIARLSPPLSTAVATATVAKLQEAWQIADADRDPGGHLVAVRLKQVRRHARLVTAPATLVLRLPAETAAVKLYLAPPFAGQAGAKCKVGAAVRWKPQGSERRDEIAARAEGAAEWLDVELRARPNPEAGELEVELARLGDCEEPPVVAVSEVQAERLAPRDGRPNVLLVVFDTLRRDAFDCAAVSEELTPHIYHEWCRQGVFFTDVVSTAPWTYPALASMLTGLSPYQHRGEGIDRDQHDVDRAVPTLAELLRWQGYTTHAIVSNWQASRGLWRGFDTFSELFPYLGRGSGDERRAERVVDAAIRKLRAGVAEPFFLWTLFIDLHEPVDAATVDGRPPPAACRGVGPLPYRFEGLSQLKPPLSSATGARLECRRALYRESFAYVDFHLGRLTRELQRLGLAERTAIVAVSDHGEELFDHGAEQLAADERPRDIWGVGHGHTLYQELLQVPLLVVPPRFGRTATPERVEALASIRDVFATVLSLCGTPPPPTSTSRALWPLVPGAAASEVVSASIAYGPARRSVSTAALKAIWTAPDKVAVFDRTLDPGEHEPLARGSPQFVIGERLLATSRSPRPAVREAGDDEQQGLRALGYVGDPPAAAPAR
ncbi:MAG: sulfatase [Deltaproteobacteria bacterium]|nr:sulfatase [Deltaproteobacteria bacterium]